MRLQEIMDDQGVKQKDLAEALGVGRSSISQYATGKREPDLETLKKMADYLSVSVDYLLAHKTEDEIRRAAPSVTINGTRIPVKVGDVIEVSSGDAVFAITLKNA